MKCEDAGSGTSAAVLSPQGESPELPKVSLGSLKVKQHSEEE